MGVLLRLLGKLAQLVQSFNQINRRFQSDYLIFIYYLFSIFMPLVCYRLLQSACFLTVKLLTDIVSILAVVAWSEPLITMLLGPCTISVYA